MRYFKSLGGWLAAAGAVAVLMGAGCAKKPEAKSVAPGPADEVKLVAPAERSSHFDTVMKRLELGGTVYGYVDIDGDMLKFAETLRTLALQATAQQPMAAAFVPRDLAPFFTDLGLTDVKAFGFSSVAEGEGFRNRVFLYAPGGRHGLMAGLGGAAAPFVVTKLAAADADLVYETELDAPVIYAAIRTVVAKAAGEPMAAFMESKLKQAEPKTGLTGMDAIEGFKGRFAIVLRVDETRTFSPAPGVTLPGFDLAVRMERGASHLIGLLDKDAELRREERAGGVVAYVSTKTVPLMGWTPEILIEGDTVAFASRPGLISGEGAKLADDAGFKAALASVGETGNGLTYVSPRLVTRLRRIAELNPQIPAEQRMALERGLGMLPAEGQSLVSIRQNLGDGVLYRSHWSSSHKGLMFGSPGMVVVGTGLMAAMAIPAYSKVRVESQQKAVRNNLRQLSAASDQYFLETGKTTCVYADLVGPGPEKYIRTLRPVAGEDYTAMTFSADATRISVTLPDGREVSHER